MKTPAGSPIDSNAAAGAEPKFTAVNADLMSVKTRKSARFEGTNGLREAEIAALQRDR
jgi:hypothetical protein